MGAITNSYGAIAFVFQGCGKMHLNYPLVHQNEEAPCQKRLVLLKP